MAADAGIREIASATAASSTYRQSRAFNKPSASAVMGKLLGMAARA